MQKYTLPLGAGLDESAFVGEPITLSVTGVAPARLLVTGTPWLTPGAASTGASNPSANEFAAAAMPETADREHVLGFSQLAQAVYDIATKYTPSFEETTAFRAYAETNYDSRSWMLTQPALTADPAFGPQPLYVADIEATQGVSWIFATHFDQPCKAQALSALGGDAPWTVTAPGDRTRLQDFLVANKAVFNLHVLQTGTDDSVLRAALDGTTCAPSDLAACEALIKKLNEARSTFLNAPLSATDYDKLVTTGRVGSWVIGRVHAVGVAGLR